MKKNYLIALLALVCNFAFSQVTRTTYKGAFAPSTPMWTDTWTNFDPMNATYGNVSDGAEYILSGEITESKTLTADKVYELRGLVTVKSPAVLTIPAGVVIRSSAPNSALVICRGAKIMANGTASNPIVFTSLKNGDRAAGDWGGIVILGKGRYNINNGVNFIEGLTQNANSEFGGGLNPIDNDNSGTLKYVRIEFAGYVFSPNNELNGLTLGAVGRGTTIDYVQVSYSLDDSFEWFGGSVNGKHLVALNGLDDDFDTDNGYNGVNQFVLGLRDPNRFDISTSEGFESDNSNSGTSTATPYTQPIFTNVTMVGPKDRGVTSLNSLYGKALRLRRSTQLSVFNSIFLNYPKGLSIEDTHTPGFATATNGPLKFKNNLIFNVPSAEIVKVGTYTPAQNAQWFSDNNNLSSTTVFENNEVSGTRLLVKEVNATNYTTTVVESDGLVDYRPVSTLATTGASFEDTAFNGLVALGTVPTVVTPIKLCYRSIASPLTANLSANGVSLVWYEVAAGGVSSTTVTPSTLKVGTKTYYVAEIDAAGAIGVSRTALTVEVVALPTVTPAAIKGAASTDEPLLDASALIGTLTTVTYSTSTVPGAGETLVWTLPQGVNATAQSGTSITVNFRSVPAGVTALGLISVQLRNSNGCLGKASSISIKAISPKAPKLQVNDLLFPTVALKSHATYMGLTTELALNATAMSGTTSYIWSLPEGVEVTATAVTTTKAYYGSLPFVNPITPPTPGAGTAGSVYYKVIKKTLSNGVTFNMASKIQIGGKQVDGDIYAPIGGTMQSSGADTLIQTGVSGTFVEYPSIEAQGAAFTSVNGIALDVQYPYYSTTTPQLKINLRDVTGSTRTQLVFGVRASNGVGTSVKVNAAPNASNKAALAILNAEIPKTPKAAIILGQTIPTTIVSLKDVSKFVGKSDVFTIILTPVANANSYSITCPENVTATQVSTTIFEVNFGSVAPGAKTLEFNPIATNGIGSSEAKILKVTAKIPTKLVGTALGTLTTVNPSVGTREVTYTIGTASLLANEYFITAPEGCTITKHGVIDIVPAATSFTTTSPSFTIAYATPYTSTSRAPKAISIKAVNGVGASDATLFKILNPIARYSENSEVSLVSTIEMYPNPAADVVNFIVNATSNGVVNMTIFTLDGKIVMQSKELSLENGTNTFTENVSNLSKGIYFVKITNTTSNEVVTKKLIKN